MRQGGRVRPNAAACRAAYRRFKSGPWLVLVRERVRLVDKPNGTTDRFLERDAVWTVLRDVFHLERERLGAIEGHGYSVLSDRMVAFSLPHEVGRPQSGSGTIVMSYFKSRRVRHLSLTGLFATGKRAGRDRELRPEMLASLRRSGLLQIALAALLRTKLFVTKAGRARFEHATVWLKARRSAKLSYRPSVSHYRRVPVKRFFLGL